jgi:hypothetical protein
MHHLCKWCRDLARRCAHCDHVDQALQGALLCMGCGALTARMRADAVHTRQHCIPLVWHTPHCRPPYFQALVTVAANDMGVRAPTCWVVPIMPWRKRGTQNGDRIRVFGMWACQFWCRAD